MKIAGVIAEFNPFHSGHKYLIDTIRSKTDADAVVVICSGNFVQRGMPAAWDKSIRTGAALKNGVSAVFELPVFYSTASAEVFARAGVKFLNDLNCIDFVCFGCENDHLDLLQYIATIFEYEPDNYKEFLSEFLKNGISYPKARMMACQKYAQLQDVFDSDELSDVLSEPNNILAIEYLKALLHFGSTIKPVAIKRCGADYHSTDINNVFASATGIREAIEKKNTDSILPFLPGNCYDTLSLEQTLSILDFNTILGEKLLSCHDFSSFYGINEELSNRIEHNKNDYADIAHFIKLLQSKNYTYTAISRALLHILLNIKNDDVTRFIKNGYCSYARLLGFSKENSVLSSIKENSHFSDTYHTSEGWTRNMLDQSVYADHLYRMVFMNKYGKALPNEFQRQLSIF